MNTPWKMAFFAAVGIFTIVLIVYGFNVLNTSTPITNKQMNQYNSVISKMSDYNITVYDDMSVSGIQLKTIIDELKSEITVVIQNKAGLNQSFTSTTDSKFNIAVNPYGDFKGKIFKDENGIISVLTFTQE